MCQGFTDSNSTTYRMNLLKHKITPFSEAGVDLRLIAGRVVIFSTFISYHIDRKTKEKMTSLNSCNNHID